MPLQWYSAHVVVSIKTKNKRRKWINAIETVFLVSGKSAKEAWKKAEKLGKAETTKFSDGGTLENGEAARYQYEGIRKLMSIMNTYEHDPNIWEKKPDESTDLTHSQFGLRNRNDLKKFVTGKQVSVEYYDYGAPPSRRKKKRKD